jgi:hypothetical protein
MQWFHFLAPVIIFQCEHINRSFVCPA